MKRKTNFIRTLCHRAHKICLKELFADEINHLELILSKDGYPQKLVNKMTNVNNNLRIIEIKTYQFISKSYQ